MIDHPDREAGPVNPPPSESSAQIIPRDVAVYLEQDLGVSRETREKLIAYDALFLEYASRHNLVSRSTLPTRWQRHFLDSVQLMPLIPRSARSLVDLGSGAGFPGLVLAILAGDRAYADASGRPLQVILVESTQKKAVFLGDTAKALGLTHVTVENDRIERLAKRMGKVDVITARALGKLDQLLEMSLPFISPSSVLVFPKGSGAAQEVQAARSAWQFSLRRHQSITDRGAQILEITQPARICKQAPRAP